MQTLKTIPFKYSGGGLTLIIFLTVCIFLFSSAQSIARGQQHIRHKNVNGRKYLYLSDLARFYGMRLYQRANGCEIRGKNASFVFTYDRRDGAFNGVTINYLFAPTFTSSSPLVSEMDYRKVIRPLLRPNLAIPRKTIRRIMIDPGHGGKDDGARTSYREKDIVLSISFKLRDELRKRGFIVSMTRERDIFLTLRQRTDMAERFRADIFISIHCNATAKRHVRGIETFCLTPVGAPSTAERSPSWTRHKGNSFDNQNIYLAYLVQRFLIGNTATTDRGIKHARFAVLESTPCPAVLVECGFMTNEWEVKNLAWSKYRQTIAESIAQAITYYAKTVR